MDDRVRRLRSRLEVLSRGRAPRGVRYPVEFRAEVVGLAREARGAGRGAGALAKQLGSRWARSHGGEATFAASACEGSRWRRRGPRCCPRRRRRCSSRRRAGGSKGWTWPRSCACCSSARDRLHAPGRGLRLRRPGRHAQALRRPERAGERGPRARSALGRLLSLRESSPHEGQGVDVGRHGPVYLFSMITVLSPHRYFRIGAN